MPHTPQPTPHTGNNEHGHTDNTTARGTPLTSTSCVCVPRRHRAGSREQAHAGRPTRRAKRRADRPQAGLPEAGLAEADLAEAGLAEVGLLLHLQEGLEGRARAHEVAVAVGVVDARGGRPELVLLEAGLRLGLGLGLG